MHRIQISTRTHLSYHFMSGASMFARQSWELEHGGNIAFIDSNKWYAMAAVSFSFSAIEANINEFYKFFTDNNQTNFIKDKLDANKIRMLSEIIPYIKQRNTLDKYKIALSILINKKYSDSKREKQICDKAKDLRNIRNALIHFQPEDSLYQDKHEKIEEIIKKNHIKPSKLYDSKSERPYFPDQSLGHNLSEWSVKSASNFIQHFYIELGINLRAKHFDLNKFPTTNDSTQRPES